ncbi:DUF4190 domain-containing protein [Numidum massiliense]|uniref:DUF4190 domain-containing protein n=1 Tax=Numidum massiliense TaxID=1522315 RepID=UPI0006D560E4|nr:DUF4190 domain-containing protein [Numidum massiliense]
MEERRNDKEYGYASGVKIGGEADRDASYSEYDADTRYDRDTHYDGASHTENTPFTGAYNGGDQPHGQRLYEGTSGAPYGDGSPVGGTYDSHGAGSLYGQHMTKKPNGLGTAGLICGIVGAVLAIVPVFLWFFSFVLGILAIVFGAISKKRDGSGMAAIVLGAATFGIMLLWVLGFVLLAAVFETQGTQMY